MTTAMQPDASIRRLQMHKQALRLSSSEVARRLNNALGGTLVSTLAGAKDAKTSSKWAKEEGPMPRDEAIKRLYFAYEQWQVISNAEGEHVARVWFIGANPWLKYETPIMAIRKGHFKEVDSAVQAVITDSFSG